jgi:hypothetical protein
MSSSTEQSTIIAVLLWALGGVLLVCLSWDLSLPGELGAVVGMAYFAFLFWLIPRVERYYLHKDRE